MQLRMQTFLENLKGKKSEPFPDKKNTDLKENLLDLPQKIDIIVQDKKRDKKRVRE